MAGRCISLLLLVAGARRCDLTPVRLWPLGARGSNFIQLGQRLDKVTVLEEGATELQEVLAVGPHALGGRPAPSPTLQPCPAFCSSDECIGSEESGAAYVDGQCVGFCVEIEGKHYCADVDHGDVDCTTCAAAGAPVQRLATPAYEKPTLTPLCPEFCGSDECVGSDESGAAYVDGRCVGFCVETNGQHYCMDTDHGDVNCTMCATAGAPHIGLVTPGYEKPALTPLCPELCSSDECIGSQRSGAAYVDGRCVGFCVESDGQHHCMDVDHGDVDCTMCAAVGALDHRPSEPVDIESSSPVPSPCPEFCSSEECIDADETGAAYVDGLCVGFCIQISGKHYCMDTDHGGVNCTMCAAADPPVQRLATPGYEAPVLTPFCPEFCSSGECVGSELSGAAYADGRCVGFCVEADGQHHCMDTDHGDVDCTPCAAAEPPVQRLATPGYEAPVLTPLCPELCSSEQCISSELSGAAYVDGRCIGFCVEIGGQHYCMDVDDGEVNCTLCAAAGDAPVHRLVNPGYEAPVLTPLCPELCSSEQCISSELSGAAYAGGRCVGFCVETDGQHYCMDVDDGDVNCTLCAAAGDAPVHRLVNPGYQAPVLTPLCPELCSSEQCIGSQWSGAAFVDGRCVGFCVENGGQHYCMDVDHGDVDCTMCAAAEHFSAEHARDASSPSPSPCPELCSADCVGGALSGAAWVDGRCIGYCSERRGTYYCADADHGDIDCTACAAAGARQHRPAEPAEDRAASAPAPSPCPALCGPEECVGSEESGAAWVDGQCVGHCVEIRGRHYCADTDHGGVDCSACAAAGAPERRPAEPAEDPAASAPSPCPALCGSEECMGSDDSGAAWVDGQCVGHCIRIRGKYYYCADTDHGDVDCTSCTAPRSPSGAAAFEAVEGGVDRCCRGADATDNDPSYYKVRTAASLHSCKSLCTEEPACRGVEYNAVLGRCEVWTRAIEASGPAADFTCFRYQ